MEDLKCLNGNRSKKEKRKRKKVHVVMCYKEMEVMHISISWFGAMQSVVLSEVGDRLRYAWM